jgi:hypothetical protein
MADADSAAPELIPLWRLPIFGDKILQVPARPRQRRTTPAEKPTLMNWAGSGS